MNKPSAIAHAIGALKLVSVHLDHPCTVSQETVRDVCNEAVQHLQGNHPHADDLPRFYSSLLAVTPRGHLPHVTLTDDPPVNYGCVITDAAGNVVTRQVGKSIEGITEIIRLRFTAGRGEAST